MDNPFQSPSIISFCPGILGLERGLARAIGKLNVLAYCEIEAFICENLVTGMESGLLEAAPIWTDAKTFPAEMFRGKVHGIIGGYPCQPFSTAGQRKGYEDPRHLWPHLRRHIDTIRPAWCFFENVRGHLSLGYETVQKELNDLGYAVEPGIFSAEEVGAPHQRERLFILAVANSYINGYRAESGRTAEKGSENEVETQRQDGEWLRNDVRYSCTSMVNPSIIPQRKQANETVSQPNAGEAREKPSIRCFEMVHTGVHHLERVFHQKFDKEEWEGQDKRQTRSSALWPARPGEQQYDWEEPRTAGQKYRLPNSLRTMWSESRKNFAKMLGEEIFTETDRNIRAIFKPSLDSTVNGYNFREDLLRALGNSVVEQTAELAFNTLLLKHINRSASH